MDGGGSIAKNTKLSNSNCLGSGNQIEVDFRHFLVCANILKPSAWSLKCVPCSLESGFLMTQGWKQNGEGL